MTRTRLFGTVAALATLLTACASSTTTKQPAPPTTTAVAYDLLEAHLPSPEGRHSASRSTTSQTGQLSLASDGTVSGRVDVRTERRYVVCPPGRTSYPGMMQACTPKSKIPSNPATVRSLQVNGSWTPTADGGMSLSLTFANHVGTANVTCAPQRGMNILACTTDANWPVRTPMGITRTLGGFEMQPAG